MVRKAKIALGGSVLALAITLSACGPQDTQDNAQIVVPTAAATSAALPPLPAVMPMEAGPATPVRYAPAAHALPRAKPLGYARVSGSDRYAWIDRADRINDTIGDAPPDYAFDYGSDGEQPYGWETAGGYRTYAEPIDNGYRYYYYDPGADEPYLVRDPDYSYGYSDGRIVSIYDRGGRVLSDYEAQRQADSASRYYERARALRFANDQRQRRGVVAAQWADRRGVIARERAQWDMARNDDSEWRNYRQQHEDQYQGDYGRRLAYERDARATAAQQFAGWQGQGFRGNAPALYGPRPGDRAYASQQFAQQARAQQQQQQRAQQAAAHQAALQQQRAQLLAQQQQQQQAGQRAQAERQRLAAEHAQAVQQQAQTHAAALRQQQQAVAAQQRATVQARQTQALAQQQQARVAQQKAAMAQKQQAQQRAAAEAQQARVAQQRAAQVQKQQAAQRAAVQAQQARVAQQQAAQAQKQQAAQQARAAQQQQAMAQRQQAQQARMAQQKAALAEKQAAQQRAAAQAQQARVAQQRAALAQKQAQRQAARQQNP